MNTVCRFHQRRKWGTFIFSQAFILLVVFVLSANSAQGQVFYYAGANGCAIRDNGLLVEEEPAIFTTSGFSAKFSFWGSESPWTVDCGLGLDFKGYKQKLDETYIFRFAYLTLPLMFSRQTNGPISFGAGVDLSLLAGTNVRRGLSTYNSIDAAPSLECSYYFSEIAGFQLHFSYGLMPMLDYFDFDNLGNFTKEVHCLKNTSLSLRFIIRITHAKITL